MLFGRPQTVDGAIRGLLAAVADLENVIEVQHSKVEVRKAEIARLDGEMKVAANEANRAQSILVKLRQITEG